MLQYKCTVVRRGKQLEIISPDFQLNLEVSPTLRATTWKNLRAGTTIELNSTGEVQVDLDAAHQRIGITGWRGIESGDKHQAPNHDAGYRAGYHRPEFDDSKWEGNISPCMFYLFSAARMSWMRTHMFVQEHCRREPLSLVLGGFGLYDFRLMRVFLNGALVGERRISGRWHAPLSLDLSLGTPGHRRLRFGQDNVIALQLADQIRRTPLLAELDPQQARSMPIPHLYPAPFEQQLIVGQPLRTPRLKGHHVHVEKEGDAGRVVVALQTDDGQLTANAVYEWAAASPVLTKKIEITNRGEQAVRLMNVSLGTYRTKSEVSDGEQGFPVYLDGHTFAALAHPSGWVTGQDGEVRLRQYPGKSLAPGESFHSMEAVYGAAPTGEARREFVSHVHGRTRRVWRGHDRPYAIYASFGSWPIPTGVLLDDKISEKILLNNLKKVDRGQRQDGCRFDLYSIDFWADPRGDLQRTAPERFPVGFDRVLPALKRMGIAPGLWIDSSMAVWTIGGNPVLSRCRTHDPAYYPNHDGGYLCRATDPAKTIYETAFRHHLRNNGVRLLKFDQFQAVCYNTDHSHLPGIYSTEAIHNSAIEFLSKMDAECPDVFLMLYWGYRSPWWLLHADTLFEPGLAIEAAHPAHFPTLFARDGINLGLDQAQRFCQDIPPLGKDSLGVWLSDWAWNSSVGTERWQEGFILDLCRGSLLAQPWSDHQWLNPSGRKQIALFIGLLKARPGCFAKPRFILGDPWKNEPYGYCCTDGRRAFIVINNCVWNDTDFELDLGAGWGLTDRKEWDIYRWHPNPARLRPADDASHSTRPWIALRPFEVVLLEIIPAGARPSLNRHFITRPIPRMFRRGSIPVPLTVKRSGDDRASPTKDRGTGASSNSPRDTKRRLTIRAVIPPNAGAGTLAITAERTADGMASHTSHPGKDFNLKLTLDGKKAACRATLAPYTHPAAWQAWRIRVPQCVRPRRVKALMTIAQSHGVDIRCRGYFLPD